MLPLHNNHMLYLQVSKQIMDSKFPVNKELALELAALMAQVVLGRIRIQWDSDPELKLEICGIKEQELGKIQTYSFLLLGRV